MIDKTATIHPSSYVEDGATIKANVSIGPFCTIGKDVIIETGTRLISHVCIEGNTYIGKTNIIYPFVSIGFAPQFLKFEGEETRVNIGDNNTFREHTTIHKGTKNGKGETRILSNGFFMVGVHIAHDCTVGNNVIMANNATLAGHVILGDHVILGGLSAVHQFVRIGDHTMIGGMCGINRDVIPYAYIQGEEACVRGINVIGLKRRGFSDETIKKLLLSYRHIFSSEGSISERIDNFPNNLKEDPSVFYLWDFLHSSSKRSFCMPKDVKDS